jgi:hypothetical protein
MAYDQPGRRLWIGCRVPASVAVFDSASGKPLGGIPAVGDTDDLFYDAARRRLYMIGGEGAVDVFEADGARLRRLERLTTREGARTGLWVASEDRLYVAVPARRGQSAEIRVLQAAAPAPGN